MYKFSIALIFLLFGCINQYEKDLVGTYTVSTDIHIEDKIILELKEDKMFALTVNDKLYEGKWIADDSGDFTWIEFITSNNIWSWGYVGSGVIILNNPQDLYLPEEAKNLIIVKR